MRQVIDESLVAEANRHVDWLIEHNPDLPPERLGYWLTPTDPFWMRLVSDPRLVDVAAAVVGPDVALFAADYIAKPPNTGQRVAWHQDASYWPLEPMQVVTLWVAYTESNRANGCVRVIPGTQHMSLQAAQSRRNRLPGRDAEGDGPVPDFRRQRPSISFWNPGDVSLHHPMIIHGSEANTSSRWRRGGTYQYIPTHHQGDQGGLAGLPAQGHRHGGPKYLPGIA